MSEAKPTLHIAFHRSIAGSIGQAFQKIGRSERVIGPLEDLSFGPIDDPTSDKQSEWIERVVGYDWAEIVHMDKQFWQEATSPDVRPIAWVNLHDAQEYCGFLEFVWKMGNAPFAVIDATNVEFTNRQQRKWRPRSLGVVPPEQMIEAGMAERAREITAQDVKAHRALWRQLKAENAPLRIVGAERLVSAAIDHFDPWLMRHATEEWQKSAQVVGGAMGELFASELCPHVSDIWLWSRICALAEQGALEIEGDPSEMRGTRVRRLAGETLA